MDNYCKLFEPQREVEEFSLNFDPHYILHDMFRSNFKVTILDYGCGPAGTFEHKNIVGFDIDVNNTFAKYHNRDEIIGLYDVIIIKYVIEHMDLNEVIDFLEWAKLHCKTLIICIPNVENPFVPFWIDLTHKFPYYAKPLAKLMGMHGYDVQRLLYCNIEPSLRRRFFDALLNINPYQDVIITANPVFT